jgi:hypothetical protein
MNRAERRRVQKLAEERARKLGIQSASTAVIVWMTAYYIIICFHLNYMRQLVSGALGSVGIVGLWLALPVFSLAMKGGTLFVAARTLGVRDSVRSIAITANLFLAGLIGFGATVLYGGGLVKSLLSSKYWAGAHWLWICSALLLLFGFLYSAMLNARLLKWQFLTDLKAVPIISPAFCLAGPKLWSDNLDKTLFQDRFPIYNILSITAACLFLAYWIAFAIFNQQYLSESGKLNLSAPSNSFGIKVCLALCAAGLYLLLVVLLDILLKLATQ